MTEARMRPSPDELLAQAQAEERERSRGKLRVFLGYAAGVGKTYTMLEAAHRRGAEGVDVVIGYVETHGRPETEALLKGLEAVPRKAFQYRGIALTEMDLDAVLARHPKLAIVDELAHTNAPGARHTKRYQDVEELLEAGIDVYTTLNIQHVESLNDVVAQITGITVHETIPDSVLDSAEDVELIDLTPDELLQRLKEGKVYVPRQAEAAIARFFRKGNLTALRELTMRRAAERVDDQMRDYMRSQAIPGPWPAGERLLACLTPGAPAERVVRATRRLADQMGAEWVALYIETPQQENVSQLERDRLARALELAEELGGKAVTIMGHSVADAVMEYARAQNITRIVASEPLRPRWRQLLGWTLVGRLMRLGHNIDVFVVSGEEVRSVSVAAAETRPRRRWTSYAQAVALVALATGIGRLVSPFFSTANVVSVYLLAVVLAALYLGWGPSLLASALGVLAFDFFFVNPRLTFAVADTQYVVTFLGLFAAAVVISRLTIQVRKHAEAARRREKETSTLHALSRGLSIAEGVEGVSRVVVNSVSETFGLGAAVFLPGHGPGIVDVRAQSLGFVVDENEAAVAAWAYQHREPAGRSTDTLSAARALYLPLKGARGTVGVLGVALASTGPMPPEQRRVVEAFAGLAALALERAKFAEEALRAQVLQASERLQAALLNSISHDLRTPLVSITGVLTTLQDRSAQLDDDSRQAIIESAREEAERLNRLVGNLLDMSRIEAGSMRVRKQPQDVREVVGTALEQFSGRVSHRKVKVDVPQELPLVPMDFVLMVQVLVNLIDNSLKYSPTGSPICIAASVSDGRAEIAVSDRGAGIPPADLARVFDKFYRVQRPDNVTGTGLGLSVCKGIVEAHGGRIWAENREGGGTTIHIALPLMPADGHAPARPA